VSGRYLSNLILLDFFIFLHALPTIPVIPTVLQVSPSAVDLLAESAPGLGTKAFFQLVIRFPLLLIHYYAFAVKA
jgi:hypothetical protein